MPAGSQRRLRQRRGRPDSDRDAGGVTVSAGALAITGGAVVASSTLTGGNAGECRRDGQGPGHRRPRQDQQQHLRPGNAGRVTVDADRLLIDGGGFSAGTAFATGILSEAQTSSPPTGRSWSPRATPAR